MSDPLRKANFTRNCWIEFDSEENCNKAAMSMNGLMIKNETLNVSKAFTKVKKVKVLKNYPKVNNQILFSLLLEYFKPTFLEPLLLT